jgi:hypothetical protein
MKLFAYLAFLCMFFVVGFSACNDNNRGPKAPETKRMELDSTSQFSDQNYKVFTLEGCEYIVYGYGNSRWGSHKGNCKNHQSDSTKVLNKEIKDLKKYILKLEEENKLMGSELGYKEFNK